MGADGCGTWQGNPMKTDFDHARDYLDRLPPAVSGAGGHAATFTAACWCVRFGLGDGEAMALLRDYSRRCSPPWTGRELAHKLADARRAASVSVRYLPVRPAQRVTYRPAPRKVADPVKVEPPPAPDPAQGAELAEPSPENAADVLPYRTESGDLVVPFASPARFHYWKRRDATDKILTLAEIGQSLNP
jgi:hypothetical protein